MVRPYAATGIVHVVCKLLLCLVLQSAKQVMAGDSVW
jgi:hypothetical protein